MDNWKITFGGKPMTLVGKHLAAGRPRAPLFEVIDREPAARIARRNTKTKRSIISVFPSVDTSVCALQNIRFNREATKLDGDVGDPVAVGRPAVRAETLLRGRAHRQRARLLGLPRPGLRHEVRIRHQGAAAAGSRRRRRGPHKEGLIRYIEYVSGSRRTSPTTTRR